MRRSLSGRRILITGASSGIGRALAMRLAQRNARLLLTARRTERLEDVATAVRKVGGEALIVPGDICEPATRSKLLHEAEQRYGGLDMVINNAGIGGLGTFSSADEARLRRIMEVNFFAAAELVRSALPQLRSSDDGVIVNIGSVLGHCAVPKKSEYCASKFALHGLTDALRMELADEGIDVLLVSPSTTSSEFFDQAMRSDGDAAMNQNTMSPEDVAQQVVLAIERGRREVILSIGGKLLVWADRIVPSLMSRLLRKHG